MPHVASDAPLIGLNAPFIHHCEQILTKATEIKQDHHAEFLHVCILLINNLTIVPKLSWAGIYG